MKCICCGKEIDISSDDYGYVDLGGEIGRLHTSCKQEWYKRLKNDYRIIDRQKA